MKLTSHERTAKIESYGRAYDSLIAALPEFPKEMWRFKPAPEKWSVHEIIVHLADSEANSFIRCRRFIAEPGSTVMAYDENKWAKALKYHEQSTGAALELFRILRQASFELIRRLPDSAWDATVNHPENGIMTFEKWLDVYEQHVPIHIRQMRRNLDAWTT